MAADKSPIDEALLYRQEDLRLLHRQEDLRDEVDYDMEQLLLPTGSDMEQQLLLPTDGGSFCMTGASFGRSCLNLSNVISGIGMLSIPYALSQGGWLSLTLFAIVGAICFYTGNLIDRCMRADHCVRSYLDIGYLAFGSYGLVMYVELYLVVTSFLILEGDNLDKLLPGIVVEILGYQVHGKQLFVLAAAAVILPTTWLKNLSMVAYVSAVGLVSSVALTASLVWAGVAGKGFHMEGSSLLNLSGLPTALSLYFVLAFHMEGSSLLNLSGLPTALSLYFVCFAGHGVFPTVYSSMNSKKIFLRVLCYRTAYHSSGINRCLEAIRVASQLYLVLLISSVLCSLNYTVTAVLGYLIYGEDVQAQVTLNLPTGKLYTRIAILTTLITPLEKYALVIQPVTIAIEEKLSATTDTEINRLTRVLTSTAVVISTVVLACTVPFFGYLMSFIGSSLNVTVAVLFLCLSYLKIYISRGGVGFFEMAAIIGILVIGVCVAVVGAYTSLPQIIGTF
uniref:Amino acid transporter transmembrane domain-containing protein n=1 Tax=Oryza meridionalis TaxID=40149 RepID=A0A0E0C3Y0_9ORYZ